MQLVLDLLVAQKIELQYILSYYRTHRCSFSSNIILHYTSKFNYFKYIYIYIYIELVGHGICDFDCLFRNFQKLEVRTNNLWKGPPAENFYCSVVSIFYVVALAYSQVPTVPDTLQSTVFVPKIQSSLLRKFITAFILKKKLGQVSTTVVVV